MSVRIYPVVKTEPFCDDYSVKVNGILAETNTARASAIPFNRRWPGHQRDVSQSEPVQFLSLAADEALEFEVTPKHSFDEVKIRPASLGIEPEISLDGKIKFTLEKPAYFTVEAYGRNKALHVFVDSMPEYNVNKNSKSTIYFGAGEHDVGEIILKSGDVLFIDEGAVVYACVYAIDADNISILGRGILDNSRNKEKILFEANATDNQAAIKNANRRHTVVFEYCNNIKIDGITIRDSLVYNIRPLACNNIDIKNVKIIGCWRYNSDGIDMHNCENVHISDCFLRTFDDSVCVKGFDCYYDGDVEAKVKEAMYRGGKSYENFKNVLVENCVIWNDWSKCLEIGAETRAEEICNIVFRGCKIIHVTGNVLDCSNVDYADVHNITFEDIDIELDDVIPQPMIQKSDDHKFSQADENYVPNIFNADVLFHHEYSAGGKRRGKNRDITFINIRIIGNHKVKASFTGYDANSMTENVTICDIYQNGIPLEELTVKKNEYTNNITFIPEKDEYAEMKKNTVKATNQLQNKGSVRFDGEGGIKIMFVGNSITLHGYRPEIGWFGEWGMAASSIDKDYVHLLMKNVRETREAEFCICQVSAWEKDYKKGETLLEKYEAARSFGADIIVFRAIENCQPNDFDTEAFRIELTKLLDYLDGSGKAKFIITTGFWKHPGDVVFAQISQEKNCPLVFLGDLGQNSEMKAIGLFEHKGVANHPGDLGMQTIADRIFEELENLI